MSCWLPPQLPNTTPAPPLWAMVGLSLSAAFTILLTWAPIQDGHYWTVVTAPLLGLFS